MLKVLFFACQKGLLSFLGDCPGDGRPPRATRAPTLVPGGVAQGGPGSGRPGGPQGTARPGRSPDRPRDPQGPHWRRQDDDRTRLGSKRPTQAIAIHPQPPSAAPRPTATPHKATAALQARARRLLLVSVDTRGIPRGCIEVARPNPMQASYRAILGSGRRK